MAALGVVHVSNDDATVNAVVPTNPRRETQLSCEWFGCRAWLPTINNNNKNNKNSCVYPKVIVRRETSGVCIMVVVVNVGKLPWQCSVGGLTTMTCSC